MASRYGWAAVALLAGVLAVAAQEPAVPQHQRMLKGDDARRVSDLEKQWDEQLAAGKRDEARRVAEEVLALRARVQGKDHWQVRDAEWQVRELARPLTADQLVQIDERTRLTTLVGTLYQQGKFRDAQPFAEKALALARKALGDAHPHTAECLNNLALLYQDQGKLADAEPLLREAVAVTRKAMGDAHPATATNLSNLALLYLDQKRLADAEPLLREVLAIRRNALGDFNAETATSLNNLSGVYRAQRKLADAEPLLRESLAVTRKALGTAHPSTAMSLQNLAVLYMEQKKMADAEPLLREALAVYRKTLGDAHPQTALNLHNIAGLYHEQGKHADAEPLLREALAVYRKTLGDAHPQTAASLESLAWLFQAQGKLADAEPLRREALAVYRKAHGVAHPQTVTSLDKLAQQYLDQKRLADAEPLLREVLAARRKTLGDAHPDTAQTLHNLAGLYQALGRRAEAEPLAQEALVVARRTLKDAHPSTAHSLNNLAGLYRAQGKLADAEPLALAALAAYRTAHGDAHPDTARSLYNLAVLYWAQGKQTDAEPLLRESTAAAEAARLATARGIDRSVASFTLPSQLLAASLAARGETTAATAVLDAGLARGLLDELSDRRPTALTPAETTRRDELVADLDRLQPRVFFLATRRSLIDADRTELAALAADRVRLEGELAKLAVVVSRRELADSGSIRNALPPEAAWVAWLDVANGEKVDEAWACVVRPNAEPRWVRVKGTGDKIAFTAADSSLPQRLRLALAGDAEKKLPPASAAEVADLAKKLREQRIAPALPHLAGVKTIYVSAVGHMAGVPVELLAPEFTVSYTPSGTFLAKLKDKARPTGDAVLAVGDPVFTRPGAAPAVKALPPGGVLVTTVAPGGAAAKALIAPGDVLLKYGDADLPDATVLQKAITDHAGRKTVPVVVWRENQKATATRDVDSGKLGVAVATEPAPVAVANRRKLDALVSARGGDWKELPGTRVELDRLRLLFGARATVLADSAASEHGLNDLRKGDGLARFRFLHLATHGEGNTVRAMESSLILAQDHLPGDLLAKEGQPLLDGRLTAREVLDHWKLDAELVTLSACETAIGMKAGGDGLLGFAQAFLTAGSRSVCLSLWRVDDTATALLMDRFYRNLLGRREGLTGPMGKAAALAEAKAWLRELTADQALAQAAALTNGVVRGPGQPALRLEPPAAGGGAVKPFAHPRYWAAFILVGDPN